MAAPAPTPQPRRIYRHCHCHCHCHCQPVRVMRGTNRVCLAARLVSAPRAVNAHPTHYRGRRSDFYRPWVPVSAVQTPGGHGGSDGVTRLAGRSVDTLALLGASRTGAAEDGSARAFPTGATLPGLQSLALARNRHLFSAWVFVINGLACLLHAALSRHLRRDPLPRRGAPRNIGGSIIDHLLFRHPTGQATKRCKGLQSLAYLVVIFGLLPRIIVAGRAMSPRLDAVSSGWVDRGQTA